MVIGNHSNIDGKEILNYFYNIEFGRMAEYPLLGYNMLSGLEIFFLNIMFFVNPNSSTIFFK